MSTNVPHKIITPQNCANSVVQEFMSFCTQHQQRTCIGGMEHVLVEWNMYWWNGTCIGGMKHVLVEWNMYWWIMEWNMYWWVMEWNMNWWDHGMEQGLQNGTRVTE